MRGDEPVAAKAPNAQVVHGDTACSISLNDLAPRPPRIVQDGAWSPMATAVCATWAPARALRGGVGADLQRDHRHVVLRRPVPSSAGMRWPREISLPGRSPPRRLFINEHWPGNSSDDCKAGCAQADVASAHAWTDIQGRWRRCAGPRGELLRRPHANCCV